jgi:hypothetical protein
MTRLLEGYHLPRQVARWLMIRQLRRLSRLKMKEKYYERRQSVHLHRYLLIGEQVDLYPRRRNEILPTRLGNAFKAAEVYGSEQYQLDGQAVWFELESVVPERLYRELEDTQAQVDFFLGFVGQFSALAIVSFATAASAGSTGSLALGVILIALSRLAYLGAVKNMSDVKYSIQAMINIGRPALANALGYDLPLTLKRERRFWDAWMTFVNTGSSDELEKFDIERRHPSAPGPQ